MNKKILVIGGYGAVGRIITTHLGKLYPNQVITAGRSLKKAQQLANELSNQVIPYQIDIANFNDVNLLENVGLVIMCIDQYNSSFIETCIKKGIDYIDITANQKVIEQIEYLNNTYNNSNSSIVLSVGLAPGLTNILAQHSINQMSDVEELDIYILLGLGEKHGDFAYKWTFDNIHKEYNILLKGNKAMVKSFSLPKQTNLLGQRKFYLFDFSDQHVLAKTTIAKQVLTRFAFDSNLLTRTVAFFRKIGLTSIFKKTKIQNFLLPFFQKINIGTDIFAIKIEARNMDNQIYECTLKGNGEGKITAYTAIEIAKYLYDNNINKGLFHSHQIIKDIPDFLEKIKAYDSSIHFQL